MSLAMYMVDIPKAAIANCFIGFLFNDGKNNAIIVEFFQYLQLMLEADDAKTEKHQRGNFGVIDPLGVPLHVFQTDGRKVTLIGT
jgi:hypothetical protein